MSAEPAWYEDVRAHYRRNPHMTKPALARHFGVSRSTIWRILNPEAAPPLKGNEMSSKLRERWADPEWARAQRIKIKLGMAKTSKPIGRAMCSPAPQGERPQPWKPGDPKPERLRRAG